MEKHCLDCGEKIFGRADKKFCNDLCRNSFNNKLKKSTNNFMRNIDNILKKNRRILEELNPEGKIKVHKNKLVSKGFDFGYYTNIYRTKNDNTYIYVYEYGYLSVENDYYVLVKKDF